MAFLYSVRVTEVTTRVVEFKVEAANHDEAVRLGEYEAANGSLKGEESTRTEVVAEFDRAVS